jgi:hypothetical protein
MERSPESGSDVLSGVIACSEHGVSPEEYFTALRAGMDPALVQWLAERDIPLPQSTLALQDGATSDDLRSLLADVTGERARQYLSAYSLNLAHGHDHDLSMIMVHTGVQNNEYRSATKRGLYIDEIIRAKQSGFDLIDYAGARTLFMSEDLLHRGLAHGYDPIQLLAMRSQGSPVYDKLEAASATP